MIGKRIDGPYTVIGNEAAQDSSLSWKARGLLIYLLSLPRDWNIRLSELARHATDGIDSTRKAMDELLNAGYIQRGARIRKPDGKLGDYVYLVTGVRDDLPELEKPTLKKPTLEKPTLENPTLYIKDLERKDLIKEKTKQKEKTPLPAWLSEELWNDFKEHRKLLRKPLTPLAATRILKTLEQVAADYSEAEARQCLDTSIANGWLGVFPPKAQAATSPRFQSADEKNQSVLDAFLKGDANGKQGNDHQSAEELGGQHWADHFQRPALRVV